MAYHVFLEEKVTNLQMFLPIFVCLFVQFTFFNRLEASKPDDSIDAMPGYFRFLTLMAYHVFLEEKVKNVQMFPSVFVCLFDLFCFNTVYLRWYSKLLD